MSSEGKVREFWVGVNQSEYNFGNAFLGRPKSILAEQFDVIFHVIEMSAYLALKEKCASLEAEIDAAKRMIATREMSLEILNQSLAERKHQMVICIKKIESSTFVFSACLDYLKADNSAQAKYLWELIQRYMHDRE